MRVYQLRLSISVLLISDNSNVWCVVRSGCVDQRVNFAKFIPCVWQKCLVCIELGIDAVMAMILRFALHLHVVSPLLIGEAPNSWVVAGFIEFMTRPLSPKQATLKNTTRPCSHHRRSAAAPGSRRRWWRCCATAAGRGWREGWPGQHRASVASCWLVQVGTELPLKLTTWFWL